MSLVKFIVMWRHTVAEGGSPAGRAVLEVFRLRRELMLHARGRCEHAARVRRQQTRIRRLQNTYMYVHKLVIVKLRDSDKYMTERILASLQFYIVICATQNVWSAFCFLSNLYLLHVHENTTAQYIVEVSISRLNDKHSQKWWRVCYFLCRAVK